MLCVTFLFNSKVHVFISLENHRGVTGSSLCRIPVGRHIGLLIPWNLEFFACKFVFYPVFLSFQTQAENWLSIILWPGCENCSAPMSRKATQWRRWGQLVTVSQYTHQIYRQCKSLWHEFIKTHVRWMEWVISNFNGTSTPKGSNSAKTHVNCTRTFRWMEAHD